MKTYQVLIASDLNKKYQGIDFSSKLLPAIVPPGMPPVMMPPVVVVAVGICLMVSNYMA